MTARVSVSGAVTLFDHILRVPCLSASSATVFVAPVGSTPGEVHFGGCGANQAAAIAALGCQVELLGVVGADFETSGYAAHLTSLGVDTNRLTVIAGERSGHSYIVHDEAGETFLVVEEGVATRGSFSGTFEQTVADSSRLLVLNMPFDRLALALARDMAARNGSVLLSGQLATASPAIRDELLRLANYVCCNRTEAKELELVEPSGEYSARCARLRGIWVTGGVAGIRHLRPGAEALNVPSLPVPAVVDPTGAGDGVVAGVAVALAAGAGPLAASRAGAVVASFVVEGFGCQASLPNWEQFCERHESAFGERPSWTARAS